MPSDPSFRDPRDHPWWQHVPHAQRRSCRRQLRLLRLREWWERRSSRSLVMLLIYLAFCLGLLVVAQPHLALTAALPLLLVPPLAALSYWLLWHEFHR